MVDTTDAKIGFGTLFQIASDASPASFVTVGEITDVKPPKMSRDAVDATHMQSPNGWREFIAGLKDGGEASFEMNFVPGSAGMTLLLAQFDDEQLSSCKITIPTNPAYAWTFDGVVTAVEPAQPMADKMTTTVTVKVSGKPTLAADA